MKKPTFEEVQHYCLSRRSVVDPAAFMDYQESVGWMVGKKPMKDWQAAVRTWERRQKETIRSTKRDIIENARDRSWAD